MCVCNNHMLKYRVSISIYHHIVIYIFTSQLRWYIFIYHIGFSFSWEAGRRNLYHIGMPCKYSVSYSCWYHPPLVHTSHNTLKATTIMNQIIVLGCGGCTLCTAGHQFLIKSFNCMTEWQHCWQNRQQPVINLTTNSNFDLHLLPRCKSSVIPYYGN